MNGTEGELGKLKLGWNMLSSVNTLRICIPPYRSFKASFAGIPLFLPLDGSGADALVPP